MVNPEEDLDSHSKREKLEERKGVHVSSLSGTSPDINNFLYQNGGMEMKMLFI